MKKKGKSRFDCYNSESVVAVPRVIPDRDFRNNLAEIAEILYDYLRQQQKKRSALSNESSEPQLNSEVA